ncbi:hypothetical protein PIB30_030779, partial [Stylosanthes scabra]|nr:hypothetical protein [Stylosanthes scabra]
LQDVTNFGCAWSTSSRRWRILNAHGAPSSRRWHSQLAVGRGLCDFVGGYVRNCGHAAASAVLEHPGYP